MCDYSLTHLRSRPAVVGDKLETFHFGTGTTGFRSVDEEYPDSATMSTAICVLPGTELAFDEAVKRSAVIEPGKVGVVRSAHKTAIFRQINKDQRYAHHDAVELPDGECVLLTHLKTGQKATVLQLPAQPKTEQEAKEQERLAVTG